MVLYVDAPAFCQDLHLLQQKSSCMWASRRTPIRSC
jgi:hypothetical protein